MFHGYYDFLLHDIKVKPKPVVLHHNTCPICDSKRVNVYYSNQLDKYICKRCMEKLLRDNGGAEQ